MDKRHDTYPIGPWDLCDGHVWEEIESQFSNEYKTDMRCKICGCPGDQDRDTGDVFWPAT